MLRLAGYVVTEELARNEAATLYRGHEKETGTPVLLKLLLREHPNPRDLQRLRHEAMIAGRLDIPAVVRPIRIEEHGHGLLLVLADPGGAPLRARMLDGLDLGAALEIAVALAEAIDAVHARHVIHKDIQPDNIIVEPATASVRLTGFGVATELSRETNEANRAGAFEGTLAYVSPEQTGRMNRALDRRSDLYSFGAVLYEMLTGAPPFVAADAMELLHAHLARAPAPPHERAPEVPRAVSDIAMKLLAKAPEDRYQTGAGAARDLSACLSMLRSGRPIAPFPLGRHDPGSALRIPERLYGRARETGALLDAWRRASHGKSEMLLVSGYSGIGKSVLVNEIHPEIARARGHFVSGKFDELGRSVPYLPVARAFQALVLELLSEREDALARYRERIRRAVGPNGRVLIDLIPDLERIIGPQPGVPDLPEDAARNRFAMVFQDFLRALLSPEHPLAIFLDDLQWADLASLELIRLILTAPDNHFLLLIGAYRDNEVDAGHPLSRTLTEIGASVAIGRIELGPLPAEDVRRFVADALGEAPERTDALAAIVYEKTQGNPFFLIQFLTALHQDGLLVVDDGTYRYDPAAIRARMPTDNVSAFMAARIRRFAPETQRALELGACIGHRFSLRTLAVICEAPPVNVAADLWPALEEGVLLPVGGDYRFFTAGRDPAFAGPFKDPAGEVPPEIDAELRFSHDRVRDAAYSLIDEAERPAIHLQIGRLLWAGHGEDVFDDVFDVTTHLNRGAALLDDPGERLSLARLNLTAGKKARASMATREAAAFFQAGVSLLGDEGWEQAYDLAFALHTELAACEGLAGTGDRAEPLHAILLAHARTDRERALVHELRSHLRALEGRHMEAITETLAGLRLVGIEVFDSEAQWTAAAEAEGAAVQALLRGRRIEDLVDAPRMTDPDMEAAMRLLLGLDASAIGNMPALHFWSTVKSVRLSLEHGNASVSARAFALYGAHLAHFFGRHAEAYELCKLGIALHDRHGNPAETCMIHYSAGGVFHYAEHWRAALAHFARARDAGLESGDFLFLSFACSHTAIARILIGDPLHEVRAQTEQSLALMRRTRVASSEALLTVSLQIIRNLEGATDDRRTHSVDEEALVARLEQERFLLALAWYCTGKGLVLYLVGDYEGAARLLLRAREHRTHNFTPEVRFYCALAILSLGDGALDGRREELDAALAACVDELEIWARACPANYLHELLLVQAERARRGGDELAAMRLYDQAIEAAQASDLPSGVALASEAAARFYLERGSPKVARAYLIDAYYAYARWGAATKLGQLRKQYPGLVPVEAQADAYPVRPEEGPVVADVLDLAAFVRIQETLSRELVLPRVIEHLMRTILQNAGAERAFLLRERDAALLVDAYATADPPEVQVELHTPLDERPDLPATIVRYVERRRDLLVLDDASRAAQFAGDPYIIARRPRSVACLTMAIQGRPVGVLYLENNAIAGAFTKARVEMLGMLLSQAAISIENAELYTRLQAHATRLAELSTPVIPITDGMIVMPLTAMMDVDRAAQMREAALEGVYRRRARILILDITGIRGFDAGVASAFLSTASALSMLGAEAVLCGVSPPIARTIARMDVDLSSIAVKATLEESIRYGLARLGQRWVGAHRAGSASAAR